MDFAEIWRLVINIKAIENDDLPPHRSTDGGRHLSGSDFFFPGQPSNLTHTRQSRPDSGHGARANVLKTFEDVPFSRRWGRAYSSWIKRGTSFSQMSPTTFPRRSLLSTRKAGLSLTLVHALALSLALALAHTHAHTLSHSRAHTRSLSLSRAHTHALCLCLSLTHTLAHTHALFLSHAHSLSHTHALSLSFSLTSSLPLCLVLALSIAPAHDQRVHAAEPSTLNSKPETRYPKPKTPQT